MAEFVEFGKIARLSRECVITEKIDGTNAQIYIRVLPDDEVMPTDTPIVAVRGNLLMYAGSRNRWLLPGQPRTVGGNTTYSDNFGFAAWVEAHADELAQLGEGRHFGEWWGAGIQRRYGLAEKRFSLFNVARWHQVGAAPYESVSLDPRQPTKYSTGAPACCHVVPVIGRGNFDTFDYRVMLATLESCGSYAAPGFMKPEGIVIFHTASGQLFKKTIEKDAEPKSKGVAA